MSRREIIAGAGSVVAAGMGVPAAPVARPARMRYSLNTATIRGQKLPITEVIDIAARAGYSGIEPWLDEVERHVQAGGSIGDLARRIADHGMAAESLIAFPEWAVDDDHRRTAGLEAARRGMDTAHRLGARRIAAPAAGATDAALDPRHLAERYRALLDIGAQAGVRPLLEIWGFSQTLRSLGEAAFVASEAGRPDAAILADVFHLHNGGSHFEGLRMIAGSAMPVFHMNDYPAGATRDAQRVQPGQGVAPFQTIFDALWSAGFAGVLSLELFNPDLWQQDASAVARAGIRAMKDVVARAKRRAA